MNTVDFESALSDPAFATAVAALEGGDDFAADIIARARRFGDLTVNAHAAILRRHEEMTEPKGTVPDFAEPVAVEGTLVSLKEKDSDWGVQIKALLKVATEAGVYRLWGTVPRTLLEAVDWDYERLRGVRVAFEAKVTPSRDDPAFGFWGYPKQARLLSEPLPPTLDEADLDEAALDPAGLDEAPPW